MVVQPGRKFRKAGNHLQPSPCRCRWVRPGKGRYGREPLILLGDDRPKILRFISANLRLQGFRVNLAHDGAEALEQAAVEPPDLVILDLALPELDGLAALQQLRAWCQAPVLVLSAFGEEQRKVQALDLGADDYVTKPFGIAELLARSRAALRRVALLKGTASDAAVIEVGPIRIDRARRLVLVSGKTIALTRTEFALLHCLGMNAGKVLTHRDLLQHVWGPEYGDDTGSLRTFIKQLRKKVEPDPARPQYLLTEPAVGYRLVAGS